MGSICYLKQNLKKQLYRYENIKINIGYNSKYNC